jgi:hypothetical protein
VKGRKGSMSVIRGTMRKIRQEMRRRSDNNIKRFTGFIVNQEKPLLKGGVGREKNYLDLDIARLSLSMAS